ncbi:transposase [Geitlerinema sp. PCC 9228]|uniref:transposase n=1 Tax=Geitlerinema sp. PCC 9228 TaxID=111611 RepID=UPI001FCE2CB2|nr:transposase [Geitlerinema sp. PCC 9228]
MLRRSSAQVHFSWVCFKRGQYLAKGEAKQTSQICPHCGVHTGRKPLSQRTHFCSHCGMGNPSRRGSSTSGLESRCRKYVHHRTEKCSSRVPVRRGWTSS